MQKTKKILAVLLAAAMLLAVAAFSVAAANSQLERISLQTPIARTVYYEGGDNLDGDILCDITGIEVLLHYADGSEAMVDAQSADAVNLVVMVPNYTVGANQAEVYYVDGDNVLKADETIPVTVKACPIEKIEITKMPNKTVYDMDTDVMTADNFSIDRLYDAMPEDFDAMLAELGMSFAELKAQPELVAAVKESLFAEYSSILLMDTDGMELLVTYTDGSTETVTADQEFIEALGYPYPIFADQQDTAIKAGENTMVISIMGKEVPFTVTVKSADEPADGKPSVQPPKDDIKNPDIPKTGGTAVPAAAMLVSVAAGAVLVLRRKVEK